MDKAEEVLKKEIDKLDFKDGVSEPELTKFHGCIPNRSLFIY